MDVSFLFGCFLFIYYLFIWNYNKTVYKRNSEPFNSFYVSQKKQNILREIPLISLIHQMNTSIHPSISWFIMFLFKVWFLVKISCLFKMNTCHRQTVHSLSMLTQCNRYKFTVWCLKHIFRLLLHYNNGLLIQMSKCEPILKFPMTSFAFIVQQQPCKRQQAKHQSDKWASKP